MSARRSLGVAGGAAGGAAGAAVAAVGVTLAAVVAVGVTLAACREPAAPVAQSPRPMQSSRPTQRTGPAWQVRPPGGTMPIDPGAADARLLDARGCAACHAAIVDEWATSRHARAWTNGIFQREYASRPLAWCANCHAPLTTQQAGQFRDRGVDCATCHVRGGAMVSARVRPGSPHATVADPSFGSPAYCADCHEFTFPVLTKAGQVDHMTAHPMQSTVASFRAGSHAGEPDGCMACHGSRTNHAFLGGHDPGMLGAALDVAWCRQGDALHIRVRNAAAGHNVPTGDLHRHLNLRVWRSSAPEALFEAFYGLRFAPADDGGKRIVADSTIAPGASQQHEVTLAALAGEPAEPINLELTYVFLENDFPRVAPAEPFTTSVVLWRKLPGEIAACR